MLVVAACAIPDKHSPANNTNPEDEEFLYVILDVKGKSYTQSTISATSQPNKSSEQKM